MYFNEVKPIPSDKRSRPSRLNPARKAPAMRGSLFTPLPRLRPLPITLPAPMPTPPIEPTPPTEPTGPDTVSLRENGDAIVVQLFAKSPEPP